MTQPSSEASPQVVVHGTGSGLAQTIRVRKHNLSADEPASSGGTDTGPTPYDLLLSALGACTSMTIGLYARRKGWAVAGIEVRLRHSKIYAADCAECETRDGHIDRIERDIVLTGDLSDEQRKKLFEIAEKCPVHRTLKAEIDIRTRVA
jgi:putative redox protein